jgi:UDP-N-acetylglucosamine 4,6-dehydratase
MQFLDNSSILITGGTGSLGKALIAKLLTTRVRRIAIISRDELKQHDLRQQFKDERLRWFVGDIRDSDRLLRAFHGVDFIVHAAALKQVDTGEYNPTEFIQTNIFGSQNVIDAAIKAGVKKVVALSTDKASSPINLYGATKLTADKLFIAANNFSHSYGTTFSVVRYGNVMGSRGSVIPYWKYLASQDLPLPVTDKRMTRFWISIDSAVTFVLESLESMNGGELFVPKIPSMKIIDLATAVSPNVEIVEIGMRPGEKLHEEMISADDARRTVVLFDRFVVLPVIAEWGFTPPKGANMLSDLAYSSNTNDTWVSSEEMIEFIRNINE